MFYIKETEKFGRGLYASRRIKTGELVTQCEILVLSPDDTKKVNETELQFYTFKFDSERDCLVLGDGEIFNHSDNPNVSYTLVTLNENGRSRKVMIFTAKRDIDECEQLFIDYAADVTVNTDGYLAQKSLVG